MNTSENPQPNRRARNSRITWPRFAVALLLLVPSLVAARWLVLRRSDSPSTPGIPSVQPEPAAGARNEALRLADKLQADFPDAPEALYGRGLILCRFGARDEAVRCFRACIDKAPEFADPHYWLGTFALKNGEFDQAVESIQQALELDPDIPGARLALAEALSNSGRIDRAVQTLQEEVQRNPADVEAVFRLGQALFRQGRFEDAVRAHEQALQLDPECSYAWFGLAQAKARLGHEQESKQILEKFRQLSQKRIAASREAKQKFDDRDNLKAGLVVAYATAARVYQSKGNRQQAIECWQRAAQADPHDHESRAALVSLYQSENRPREAQAVLQELKALQTDSNVRNRP